MLCFCLVCPRLVFCVPCVASFSWLSIFLLPLRYSLMFIQTVDNLDVLIASIVWNFSDQSDQFCRKLKFLQSTKTRVYFVFMKKYARFPSNYHEIFNMCTNGQMSFSIHLRIYLFWYILLCVYFYQGAGGGGHGRAHMVVGFTATCAISAFHH